MKGYSIIEKRDLEPLWYRANEVARHYERAADCMSSVIGADCVAVEKSRHPKADLFCSLCKRYHQCAGRMPANEIPCSSLHVNAAKNARRYGGLHIYTCPAGFYFWTNPFFAGERFAGAFISSVFPAGKNQETLDKLFSIYRGEISRAEIAQYMEDVPFKTEKEVQAMARMIQICARQISYYDSRWGNSCRTRGGSAPSMSCLPNMKDQERRLIACLRRGDGCEAQTIVRSLIKDICAGKNYTFELLQMMAIELVVLLSRAGANRESNEKLVEANSRFLKRVEESGNAAELADNLCLIVECMSGKIFSFQGVRHACALRKAERFIWENYSRKISLREIAGVSGLSATYFSTVFKDEIGENLSNYLNRLRVEKAAAMLRETERPINEISAACGFEDQSWFSKVFKNYISVSPSKYRENGGAEEWMPSQN